MTPPPITREARDWLLEQCGADWAFRKALDMMPLAPEDPLDAVRARFQPKTRGGLEYEIFAEKGGYLYGMVSGAAVKWRGEGESIGKVAADIYDLLPVSPHATLISELLQRADIAERAGQHNDTKLFRCAADALEKQP